MATENRKKGFAGLDSMVSEVKTSDLAPDRPQPDTREKPAQVTEPQEERQQIFEGKPESSRLSGKWGAIIVLAVAVALFSLADWIKNPGSGTSTEEAVPPLGNGLTLNRAQIRYCVSEDIRLSAWQSAVNQYSHSSVDAFNAAVADYNSRCSNFRYRSGTLDSVRSEVEENRNALVLQGRARAAANP